MSSSTGFQSYGLIKSLAQQVLYRRAHLANVTTGMADPKEHHTTALMSQILSRNIFTEEHFAVLAEQPPSPASRKSVDIVVSYVTNDREDLRILCICECKRTKTTQEWSLAALERQALDYGRICLKDTGVTFIYTATMAGCRVRLWKCEDGGDRYLFTPFWGTNTTGDWNEYIDVGGHYGDVEQITTAFNHMKGVPPTPRYGQTQESYGTQDFAPAASYPEDAIYNAAGEHDDGYNAGQSSYTDPPLNAYDDESAAMDDEYNAGQSSYTDPPPNAYDDEPVAMDDEPTNYAPPAPDHRQKDIEGVTLTRISHMLKEDEFQFTDKKHHTRTTVRSDWTKGKFDGRSGYWYSGRKTYYFTGYKF